MKPLHIFMKNIGPFIEEKLDFESLDEMFLLCGDTGAGKTTIFDAMTFALYGEFLGARKGKSKDFRSQFAADGEESSVELVFECMGDKFRVTRTLPYNYVNRNGKLSQKDSSLSLEVWNQEESGFQFINGTKSELDRKLVEVIGLRADEFSKIVVLPQGEFSQFLRANSKEKQELLQKLFPVDYYQSIVERVKAESEDVRKRIDYLESTIGQLGPMEDFENAESNIAGYEKKIEEKTAAINSIQRDREKLSKDYERTENELSLARELEKVLADKEVLEGRKDEVKALEEKTLQGRNALLVHPFITALSERNEEENQLKAEQEKAEEKFAHGTAIFNDLDERMNEISSIEKQLEKNTMDLSELSKKYDVCLDYENSLQVVEREKKSMEALRLEVEKASGSVEGKIIGFNSEYSKAGLEDSSCPIRDVKDVNGALRKISSRISAARENVSSLQKGLKTAMDYRNISEKISSCKSAIEILSAEKQEHEIQEKNLNLLLEEFMRQKEDFLNHNTALSLVGLLKPGCACPVCGSLDHPSPAKDDGRVLDIEEKIATTETSLASEKKLLEITAEKLAGQRASLETLTSQIEAMASENEILQVDQMEQKLKAAQDSLDLLESVASRCEELAAEIVAQEERKNSLKEEFASADRKMAGLKATVDSLRKQMEDDDGRIFDSREIKSHVEELKILVQSQKTTVEKFRSEYDDAKIQLEKSQTALEKIRSSLSVAMEKTRGADSSLKEKLLESGFASVEQANSSFIPREELQDSQAAVESFHKNLNDLSSKAELLSGKVVEKPSRLESALESISAQMEEKSRAAEELSKKCNSLRTEKSHLEEIFTQYMKYQKEYSLLAEKSEPLAKLCADLTGGNPSKIRFESWFLGLYFDDVVTYANRHLLRLSGERYEFKMDLEKTGGNALHGLDLVVHDYRTNRDRDTATLSGGETFMASISLALGLTEVVQKSSRLDSLFIDEGFGSLDKESLEMAVGVLQEIGGSKKIGVISHVEEMLGAIACHVEVKKTSRGSHIVA